MIKPKILAFTAFYLPGYKGGGPIKTIKNLIDQTGTEISFTLITGNRDLGEILPYKGVDLDNLNTVGHAFVFYSQSGLLGYKQIAKIIWERKYDSVYLNSFFSPRFSIFPLLIAKLIRQQVIIGPRGEFSEGALNLKSFKKRLFTYVYKIFRLHKGTVFQASSEYEASDIRRVLGVDVDIFIAEDIGAQEYAKELSLRSTEVIKAVFISRISPKKNLLSALEMLKSVKYPILYHIYGPIEDHVYWKKCESVIEQLPSHIHVEHKGELMPDVVVSTLSDYDFFFMPTKGENYGHVIAEALCAGLPLLIADTTPWRNLKAQGIGWDLSLGEPNQFSKVIDELATIPAEEHLRMRRKVLSWAKEKFTQRDAIEDNLNMFRYAYRKKEKTNVQR